MDKPQTKKPISAKSRAKAQDIIIEGLYREYCANKQIKVTQIPELFRTARAMLEANADRADIGAAMLAFMQQES